MWGNGRCTSVVSFFLESDVAFVGSRKVEIRGRTIVSEIMVAKYQGGPWPVQHTIIVDLIFSLKF